MIYNLSFDKQIEFIKQMADSMSRPELESFILSHVQKAGMDEFKDRAAREIIDMTKPCDVIPEIYGEYRQIVHDGIRFLLSNFSPVRLINLALDQLMIKKDVSVEERLIHLARKVPTLHKLGQMLARNRNLDISFKKWLIQLENHIHGTDINELRKKISSEIKDQEKIFSIQIENKILAEASVGAVVSFTWSDLEGFQNLQGLKNKKGVFKVLKPNVKEWLEEELKLLDELAVFFDKNREGYTLKNFKFIETFKDIKEALEQEVDLRGEQINLKQAFLFYNCKALKIPRVLSFSTPNMTAMEHMKGEKITEASMSAENRKKCAKTLFTSLIWHPLFSREEYTLFHGDPHAGNIYAFDENNSPSQTGESHISVAVLDWSQAGLLSKRQRMNMFRLGAGVILEDEKLIYEAIGELSEDANSRSRFQKSDFFKKSDFSFSNTEKIIKIIREVLRDCNNEKCQLMKKIFVFIDQAAIKGIRFSGDLMLFRKAFFTLEGVLYDLDPAFDMDKCMFRLAEGLFMEEFPKRWAYLLFPQADSFNHYKSLISNTDMHMLANRFFVKYFKKGTDIVSALAEKNLEIMGRWFGMTAFPVTSLDKSSVR